MTRKQSDLKGLYRKRMLENGLNSSGPEYNPAAIGSEYCNLPTASIKIRIHWLPLQIWASRKRLQDGESHIKVAVNINYTYRPHHRTAGQDTVVDKTRCGLKVTGFELQWQQEIFPSPYQSRRTLRPTSGPVSWVQGLFSGDKVAGVRRWIPKPL